MSTHLEAVIDDAARAVYEKTPTSTKLKWELLPSIVQHEVREVALTAINVALAAGYTKPRTISTVAELDALPPESVIQSDAGLIYEKYADEDGREYDYWLLPGEQRPQPATKIDLPATVLSSPVVDK